MFNLPNRRGAQLSREEIEQISRELATHLTASAPLQVVRHGTGLHLRMDYEYAFMAKITSGTQPYSWQEVYPQPNGTWQVPAVARTGTTAVNPAWELNGNTKVAAGTIVPMVKGYFNYSSAGQEYGFWFNTSTSSVGGGSGTLATPLRVSSATSQAGLWPAVIQSFNPVTGFADTATNIWAVTTQLNPLQQNGYYTGIKVGTGGNPSQDIYCVNENLTVGDSAGLFKLIGRNSLLFDPSYTWQLGAGILPGQVVIERLLRVQDSQGNPPVDHVRIEEFRPYYTWEVLQDPIAGKADIRRLFEVWNAFKIVMQDVWQQIFTPSCTWDIQPNGVGSVTIRRLLKVLTDSSLTPVFSDLASIKFIPDCTWTLATDELNPCGVKVRRLFVAQTDNAMSPVFNDVSGIKFIPDCAWTLATDEGTPCGVKAKRLFVVQDNATPTPNSVSDVAKLQFYPSYTWQIGTGGSCQANVQRLLYVNSFGPDIFQFNFSSVDFTVTNPSAGNVVINTNGLTKNINYCDGDDQTIHQLQFVDGLLKARI